MWNKICNFFSTFKNPASVILGVIGAIAGGCSFIPFLPTWLNIALKVIGIGAPVIGLLVGIIKFFKNRRRNIAPTTIVERAFTSDDTLSEADLISILEDDYQEAVEDSMKNAKNPSKSDKKAYEDESDNYQIVTAEPKTKKRIKGSNKKRSDSLEEVKRYNEGPALNKDGKPATLYDIITGNVDKESFVY